MAISHIQQRPARRRTCTLPVNLRAGCSTCRRATRPRVYDRQGVEHATRPRRTRPMGQAPRSVRKRHMAHRAGRLLGVHRDAVPSAQHDRRVIRMPHGTGREHLCVADHLGPRPVRTPALREAAEHRVGDPSRIPAVDPDDLASSPVGELQRAVGARHSLERPASPGAPLAAGQLVRRGRAISNRASPSISPHGRSTHRRRRTAVEPRSDGGNWRQLCRCRSPASLCMPLILPSTLDRSATKHAASYVEGSWSPMLTWHDKCMR